MSASSNRLHWASLLGGSSGRPSKRESGCSVFRTGVNIFLCSWTTGSGLRTEESYSGARTPPLPGLQSRGNSLKNGRAVLGKRTSQGPNLRLSRNPFHPGLNTPTKTRPSTPKINTTRSLLIGEGLLCESACGILSSLRVQSN